MKLQAERIEGVNAVSSFTLGEVLINGRPHRQSILVPWQGEVLDWKAEHFESLTVGHFERIAELRPELVIFGSGNKLRFPQPALLRPLIGLRIGVETMDSGAACRTYNVLVAEGRSAVLALLLKGSAETQVNATS